MKKIVLVLSVIMLIGSSACGREEENSASFEEPETIIETESENFDDTNSIENLTKKYYGDFLTYYRDYEARGFEGQVELINEIYSMWGFSEELYYTVIDLANDGVPELFIGDGDSIYDVYAIEESCGQIWELVQTDGAMLGDRIQCTICENNILQIVYNGGAYYGEIEYWKLNEYDYKLSFIEGCYYEDASYYYGTQERTEYDGYMDEVSITSMQYWEMYDKYREKTDIQWHKLSDFVYEMNDIADVENLNEHQMTEAEKSYLRQKQEEYPDVVSHAVQNYVVNANATMSSGEIPLGSNMVNVIENEFRYDSNTEFQWEYTALQYRDCQILPVDKSYMYSFSLEDYLLDYIINDDFDEETETFSGKVYFQYRITENANSDNIIVRKDKVTVCIAFKVKYTEEQGYRLIELNYLSPQNQCH